MRRAVHVLVVFALAILLSACVNRPRERDIFSVPVDPMPRPMPMTPAVISTAQQALNAHGFPAGPVDGVMGDRTRAAIENFERTKGLRVDGVLDVRVYALLVEAMPVPPIGSGSGDRGPRVNAGVASVSNGLASPENDASGPPNALIDRNSGADEGGAGDEDDFVDEEEIANVGRVGNEESVADEINVAVSANVRTPIGPVGIESCAGIEVIDYTTRPFFGPNHYYLVSIRNTGEDTKTVRISFVSQGNDGGGSRSGVVPVAVNAGQTERAEIDFGDRPPTSILVESCR